VNETFKKIQAAQRMANNRKLHAIWEQACRTHRAQRTLTMMRPEYQFHPERKWRLDYAWPDYRIAVELHGGTWVQGGHSRGAGQAKDFEKLNAAAELGWRVFQFSTDMLREDPAGCVDQVIKTIHQELEY
jgi:very-short-patch-repair endonuclease